MYRQKMDISYCGDKTGFPRPGHIYSDLYQLLLQLSFSGGISLVQDFVMPSLWPMME